MAAPRWYAFVPFAFSNAIPRVSARSGSPLLSSPCLASPLHVSSQRRHRSSSHPSYPRLIDAGLENQDGRPITLSISRSPVYLPGNILPKNKYLRQAGPGQARPRLALRFFPSSKEMSPRWIELSMRRQHLPLEGKGGEEGEI